MTGLRHWARWTLSGPLTAVVFVALIILGVWQHPWVRDADWAGRTITSYTLMLFPLLAAVTAYDVTYRMGVTISGLARGAKRGAASVAMPLGIAAAYVFSALMLLYACAVLAVRLHEGMLPRDLWVVPELASGLVASSALGCAVGFRVRNALAAPAAAGIVLLSAVISQGLGFKLFQVSASFGTMVGIERTPARALASICLHLAVTSIALAVAFRSHSPMAGRRPVSVILGMVAVIAVAISSALIPDSESEYRPTTEAMTCFSSAGSAVRVCGPGRAEGLLTAAAADLDRAVRRLGPSGLALPETFLIARGDAVRSVGEGRTLLEYDPSTLVEGHLPGSLIASTLATPRLCAALFRADAAAPYLSSIDTVTQWITRVLGQSERVSKAPDEVRSAYARLSSCPLP